MLEKPLDSTAPKGPRPVREGAMLRRALAIVLVAALSTFVGPSEAVSEDCQPTSYSMGDPEGSRNIILSAWQGHSWGEMFVAQDSLLSAVTIWRPAVDGTNYAARQLFICGTMPWAIYAGLIGPNPAVMLYESPLLVNGPANFDHPVPYRFVIDPPLRVRAGDSYFFAIKEPTCIGFINIVADTNVVYAEKLVWKTSPAQDCSDLGAPSIWLGEWRVNIVHAIEYCETSVPTRRASWGRLRVTYR